MDFFAAFERQIEEALSHLYDPTYHAPEELCRHFGFRAPQPLDLIRDTLVQAIQQLQPATEVPAAARVRRIHDLLDLRYLQGKTQKETALRLGITVRHLRREQQLALHLLAERLWEKPKAQPAILEQPLQQITAQDEISWRQQVRHEIHVLHVNAPGVLANVQETLTTIIELADALTERSSIVLDIQPAVPNLWVAPHPSVLREMLIGALDKLVPTLNPTSVMRFSTRIQVDGAVDEGAVDEGTGGEQAKGEYVQIVLSGCPATLTQLPESKFIDEVLDLYGGTFAVRQQQDLVEFSFTLPRVNSIAVLVVDDNDDLVHFYRRYTEDTRYMIHHVAHGQHLWQKIHEMPPDVIILDVMLPDIGGWDLLRQLRKDPSTKGVPIIICSVIHNAELAKTLGANLYLSKPVRRNDFLRVLDVATRPVVI